ncbi:hypothetical protein HPB48_013631 [Haemaphysalis longicornis]|uniref:Peptidase S54 rhomboid domain-containing protein n=1 Tax=Haemaphysalis longicornis TaxID=44386 RepID=A0A9J6GV70_HAELO|nr:hypothetical protein HPB48_013631 [Haemaphysalis longicornis]
MEYVTWLVFIVVGERHIGIWALALLAYHLLYEVGLQSVPVVTGLTIALQTAIFARWLPVPWNSPCQVCLSARHILLHRQWRRLLFSHVEHTNDWHLYNNMVSFLWKAIQLENEMGGAKFAYVLALLLLLTGVIEVALASLLSWASEKSSYTYECGVGFSGVIFALKVLKNVAWFKQANPFPVWVAWYEFLETMILALQSSFINHLSGLLAGTTYVCYFQHKRPSFTPVAALISAALLRALPCSLNALLQNPCLSADLVLNRGDWTRLFLSPLFSHNNLHTAYVVATMMSLGYRYERSMGSARFAVRVVTMTAATGLLYCCFARILAESGLSVFAGVFSFEMAHKCYTGATAAILALKLCLVTDDRMAAEGNGFRLLKLIPLGRYPVLWFTLPCPPVLGAFLEKYFLDTCFPFLWSPAHEAGIIVGSIYAVLARCRKMLVR